ncbi:hypothetical protein CDAR_444811 [Caerostris darwini]|uniref:Uncharacterized protein n=1 Tax=Caerostris darwini TaxID=1538125 RepID=A0AAV4W5Y0_9ARAC|nr:hypothetical protein CDAR_444811 [Caerostris darwini]
MPYHKTAEIWLDQFTLMNKECTHTPSKTPELVHHVRGQSPRSFQQRQGVARVSHTPANIENNHLAISNF